MITELSSTDGFILFKDSLYNYVIDLFISLGRFFGPIFWSKRSTYTRVHIVHLFQPSK